MYDFAVVDIGPVGARFARRAADAGCDALALEKGEIGTPLACSGHVDTNIWEHIPNEACDRLFQDYIYGANLRVGGPNSKVYPSYKQSEVSDVINRVELDRTLANRARDAGADVHEGHTVTAVEEFDNRVRLVVSVAGEADTAQFEAKMIVGYDGPTPRVRRALDLLEPPETLCGALAFDPDSDDSDFVGVHLTIPRFFAWYIPRGDVGVRYGLVAPPGAEVNGMSDVLTNTYDVETKYFCSRATPIGLPDRTATRRAFLVGDTAAQTKPPTGGGILYGMTAADVATSVINPDDPETLSIYKSAWHDEFSREIRLGHLVRRRYSFPEWLRWVGLRSLPGEIGVHMDKPSSLFSREHLKKLL